MKISLPNRESLKGHITDIGYIVVGAFLQAFAYALFIAPADIVPGGVYGITIVLHHLTAGLFPFAPDGLPIGLTALLFNIPLMILASKKLGLSSGPKTVLTFILISIFTDTLTLLHGREMLVPGDKILSAFYGGVIVALGVLCVFKADSTSAGTDVLAKVITKGTNIKLSNMIMIIDSTVVLFGLLAFKDWSVPLYSLLTIVVYSKVVDIFFPENPNKAVFIVSPDVEEIRELFINQLKIRGTIIKGRGLFNGVEREMIFTIIERKRLPMIKRRVREIDDDAFISTMDASQDQVPLLK